MLSGVTHEDRSKKMKTTQLATCQEALEAAAPGSLAVAEAEASAEERLTEAPSGRRAQG